MKKIGVVIPIYNVEEYLRECLDSVVNQTYKNLQVVLVNDGSTDENSLNIAKEYT
ncbi:glycosyltransferase family 2 protein, partial [Campylobacter jejuni]|nr:glycosyltransferase family 2 protein [Campylobacter jejuni]